MRQYVSPITRNATVALLVGLSGSLLIAAPRFSAWSPPVNLGASVNSEFDEEGPALSKDRLSLYFTSNRPGGMGGSDIWVSQRSSRKHPWGEPVNLGSPVNTAFDEAAPSLSRDGHFIYFNRDGDSGLSEIWVARRAHTQDDFGWEEPVNANPGVSSSLSDAGAGYLENRGDEGDDRETVFFASKHPGGLGAQPNDDLYMTSRTKLRVDDAGGRKAPKVDVCHVTGNGSFHLIHISANAKQAHIDHGDGLPGGTVPGDPSKRFDDACRLVDAVLCPCNFSLAALQALNDEFGDLGSAYDGISTSVATQLVSRSDVADRLVNRWVTFQAPGPDWPQGFVCVTRVFDPGFAILENEELPVTPQEAAACVQDIETLAASLGVPLP